MYRFLTLLLFSGFLIAGSPEEEGLALAKKLDKANEGFVGEFSEMEMTLINAHGEKTIRKMVSEIREKEGGDQSLITFLWPADVKDTRMLTWSQNTGDDDQWLYLPALKRVKRISSRNKSGAFMGSEFSYEDLGSQEIEEYTYTYLGEDTFDGRKCWKQERDPVSKKSGYSKEVVWFDQEYMNPLKIEYYDRKGELLKISVFSGYTQYDKLWRASRIDVDNVQTQKKSQLIWKSREMGRSFEEDYFESDSLVD